MPARDRARDHPGSYGPVKLRLARAEVAKSPLCPVAAGLAAGARAGQESSALSLSHKIATSRPSSLSSPSSSTQVVVRAEEAPKTNVSFFVFRERKG